MIRTKSRDFVRLVKRGIRHGLNTNEQRSILIRQTSQTERRRKTSIRKNTTQSYEVTCGCNLVTICKLCRQSTTQSAIDNAEMNAADAVLRKKRWLTTINVRILPVQPKIVKDKRDIVRTRSRNNIWKKASEWEKHRLDASERKTICHAYIFLIGKKYYYGAVFPLSLPARFRENKNWKKYD